VDKGLKASKEVLDALKYAGERIVAGRNVLGRLRERVISGRSSGIKKILTERRTPIPVKITPAGGYTCITTNIRS